MHNFLTACNVYVIKTREPFTKYFEIYDLGQFIMQILRSYAKPNDFLEL